MLGMAVSSAVACGGVDVDEERARLLETDRQFAQSVSDIDVFMSYWAPDATAYLSGMPALRGTDAIRKGFGDMISAPGVSLSWTPERAEVSISGDVGYTTGTYEITATSTKDSGKYVTIWRKQPEGTWKVVEDIGNSNLPPVAPSSAVDPRKQPSSAVEAAHLREDRLVHVRVLPRVVDQTPYGLPDVGEPVRLRHLFQKRHLLRFELDRAGARVLHWFSFVVGGGQ
jgi:ketosteroid isomerase-like protein